MVSFNKIFNYFLCVLVLFSSQGVTKLVVDEKTTLNDLCSRFNINGSECNCQKHLKLCELLAQHKSKLNKTTSVDTIYTCDDTFNFMKAVSNTVVALVGLIGNGIVLLLPLTKVWVLTNCEILFIILAVSDFLTCGVRLWINIPYYWSCKWMYGWVSCKLSTSLLNIGSLISIGMISLIAVERYFGIVRPFHNGLKRTHLFILTFLNFLVNMGMIIPLYIYTNLDDASICAEQMPKWWHSLTYTFFVLVFFSILPASVLSVLYWKITRTLKLSTNALIASKMVTSHVETRRILRNRRVMTIVITITILFVVLVFPNRIVWIIKDIVKKDDHTKRFSNLFEYPLYFLGTTLYSLQAIVNPIVYSMVDKSFRNHIHRLITCQRLPRKRSSQYFHSTTRTEIRLSPRFTNRSMSHCTTSDTKLTTTEF